jgi:arylsulfatase A-like enzyme
MDYPVDGSSPTYFSQLQKAGYHVMMVGKDHLTMSMGVGLNGSIHATQLGFSDWERMPDKYEAFNKGKPYDQWTKSLDEHSEFDVVSACYGSMGDGYCCDQIQGLEGGSFCPRTQPAGDADVVYPDDWTEASAERLLDRKPAGKSWFMQVGFPGPHPPFILTEAMNKSVEGRTYPLPQGSSMPFGDEFYMTMRRQYAAEIENIDSLIGKLIKKLEVLGELENTVIAISADHGEMLGDYNMYSKSMPWDGSSRVPMLWMGPGVQAGVVSSQPVTTLDIVGTLLELAGADKAAGMTTQSMVSMLSSGAGGRSFVSSGLGGGPTFKGDVRNEDYLTNEFPPPGHMHVDWRMVVKRYNDTSILKIVCCPSGCSEMSGNTTLFPPDRGRAQLLLMEISGDQMEADLLSRGIGNTEASELLRHLPSTHRSACAGLV